MKVVFTIFFFSLSTIIFSQDTKYKVFYYDGNIFQKTAASPSWKIINEIGAGIKDSDSLMLEQRAEIYFFSPDKEQFFLGKEGVYNIKEFTDSLRLLEGRAIIGKYAEFVWEEINKPHDNLEDYAERHMKEKGGVSRAVNIPEIVTPIAGTTVKHGKILFQWRNTGVDYYTLSFYDSEHNGNRIYSQTIRDTLVSIPTNSSWWNSSDGKLYYSLTEINKPTSNLIPIEIIKTMDLEELNKEKEQLEVQHRFSPTLLRLMLASLYEKYKLYDEARVTYKLAINEDPDNKVIREYYRLFIARLGAWY